jgi:Zn-ribbon protein, possibly nucleic acid-binding
MCWIGAGRRSGSSPTIYIITILSSFFIINIDYFFFFFVILLFEFFFFYFLRIIRNKMGLGIVAIKGNVCMGCHMILPAQFSNNVRLGEEFVFCPYCSRILYYEESSEGEELFFDTEDSGALYDPEEIEEEEFEEEDDKEEEKAPPGTSGSQKTFPNFPRLIGKLYRVIDFKRLKDNSVRAPAYPQFYQRHPLPFFGYRGRNIFYKKHVLKFEFHKGRSQPQGIMDKKQFIFSDGCCRGYPAKGRASFGCLPEYFAMPLSGSISR